MARDDIITPRGKITVGGRGGATLQWNANASRFAVQGSRAQKWIDNEVLKDTTPFVPMQTGMLFKSGQLGTVIGSGTVTYIAPYARALYHGKVMVGPKYGPKRATGKALVFSRAAHSQAQAYWFEASKARNKPKWLAGAKKIAGGG